MAGNRGRKRLIRGVAAAVASLLLITALVGVVSADVGTVTVTAQTPNPVELGATATLTVRVQNTDDSTRRFAVTAISDANGVAIGGLSIVASGCASISADSTANLTVQIGTTSATPIGSNSIRLTVSQYNSDSQNCNSNDPEIGWGYGTLVTASTPLNITLYQVACPSYQYVPANESYGTAAYDNTGGHTGELNTSPGRNVALAVPGDIDTAHGCAAVPGWKLNLHRGSAGGDTLSMSPVTTGAGGFASVDLTTAADIAAARTGSGVWVDEVVPTGYAFASLRCYNDILYSDNSENVSGVASSVTQVYCLAFNYRPVLTITATNQPKTYGATLDLGTSAFTQTGLLAGDTLTGVTLTSAGSPAGAAVGAHPIVPSAAMGTGLAKYTIVYNTGTLTVSSKALTITASSQGKIYGETLNPGTTLFTTSGLVNGDSVSTVTLTSAGGAAAAAVGSYQIVPSAAVGSGLSNYAIAYSNGSLAVATKGLTVTASNQSKAYGATLDLGNSAFTTSGLINGNTVTSVTLTSAGAAAGAAVANYPIAPTAAVGTGLSNYAITYASGTLAVATKPLTITATNKSKVFGSTLVLGTTSFTEVGLLSGDTITGVTLTSAGAAAGAAVGDYPIVASAATGTGLAGYTITYVDGTLTVALGTLDHIVISPDPATIVAGTTQAYTAEGFDSLGNSLGDVTASTTFSIDGSGSACAATKCGSTIVAAYTVTGTDGELTDTAILNVVAAATPAPTPAPTPVPSAIASGSQTILGATSAPSATPPATSSQSNGSGTGTPLFALLICLAFGSLAMLMVEKQRRAIRR